MRIFTENVEVIYTECIVPKSVDDRQQYAMYLAESIVDLFASYGSYDDEYIVKYKVDNFPKGVIEDEFKL